MLVYNSQLRIANASTSPYRLCLRVRLANQQEEIALWTGVEGNESIHDEDGAIGHGWTLDIAKGLSIH